VAFSGARTGRSPSSKSIVNDPIREHEIAWGDVNKPIRATSFNLLSELAKSYLNTRRKLYVVDGYAGWDKEDRIRIRVICTRSYHALFMTNMLIRPTQQELDRDFADGADYYIFNAGEFAANKNIPDVVNETAVSLNFELGKMVILGSQYAGEMKKGVFTIMNYLMPKKGHLPLHSSCNVGKNGDVCLFFGLSGTGKTALSAVGDRELIGDDEHVWTNNGVFNIEGGCYAKCVGLSPEKEPEIYNAIKFGTVLENVGLDEHTREVNYNDISITENTRASYPLEYIPNAKIPAVTGHPNNIIFLTCDAFSVLPPVSKLTPEQAIYHFYSGYTAKIAGTEQGVKEPTPTFSACFGEAFLPLKPQAYADLLLSKINQHGTNVWLVNTGWTGGRYGYGKVLSFLFSASASKPLVTS
jgi:phosphoenolpyruvate carboxykinase (ATP)